MHRPVEGRQVDVLLQREPPSCLSPRRTALIGAPFWSVAWRHLSSLDLDTEYLLMVSYHTLLWNKCLNSNICSNDWNDRRKKHMAEHLTIAVLGAFCLANVGSALSPTFPLLLLTRILA